MTFKEGSAAKMVKEPLVKCLDQQGSDWYLFNDHYTFEIISGTPGFEIYYTLDGTDPDKQSVEYTRPVTN